MKFFGETLNSKPIDLSVFVISLSSSPRNHELILQLEEQNISPTIVSAVDGRLWSAPFDSTLVNESKFSKVLGRPPTGPEVGCALSHLHCIQLARNMNAHCALILEDDAVVTSELLPSFHALMNLDRGDPLILQVYSPTSPVLKKETLHYIDAEEKKFVAQFFTPPNGAVAYLMNRAAIDQFSQYSYVEGVADWPPFANSCQFWGFFPSPISHDIEGSTIEEKRSDHVKSSIPPSRAAQIIVTYLRLFSPSRVLEHGKSLGGITAYFKFVIYPHTCYRLRYRRTITLKSGENSIRLR
jgi:hypothetical protein